ncbi:MAG TPA: hypothetical protein DDZ68_01530 [Parvularcula sp.]|nr:hypothetical protein [Parvularcula sp.]HBS35119.1 hypothetical protein [Parvularcula sp.]
MNSAPGRKIGNSRKTCLKDKKERRGFPRRSGKNSQNAFAHQRKEIQMLRNHADSSIGNVSRFVNALVTTAMVTMIGASYFAALGRLVIA